MGHGRDAAHLPRPKTKQVPHLMRRVKSAADCILIRLKVTGKSMLYFPLHFRTVYCILDAAALGLLASAGICEISVRRRPRVCVLSAGDEASDPSSPSCARKNLQRQPDAAGRLEELGIPDVEGRRWREIPGRCRGEPGPCWILPSPRRSWQAVRLGTVPGGPGGAAG